MMKLIGLLAAGLTLAALTPRQALAADNTWNNAAGDFLWDFASANWTSPTTWVDGDNAVFAATGAGIISVGNFLTAHNLTFNAPGYQIFGNGYPLTLAGTSPTITASASVTNGLSLAGTDGLTLKGTGTLWFTGDGTQGNTYTGGTHIQSGTVVLANPDALSGGTSYAIDSVESLDAGATLRMGSYFNGSTWSSAASYQIGSMVVGSKLHMTGGTLDLYNDPKNQRIPVLEGTGLVINSGPDVQAGVLMVADGLDHEFSGVIADGNNGVLVGDNISPSQGPGYQIGIVQFSAQKNGGGGTLTLSGKNTYSGSTRIDQGATIKLAGQGTIGFPTATGSFTGPLRIYGPGGLDLNGCNQTLALMTSGNASGKIYNSAPGTVSTLTFGYGNEQAANRNAGMQFIDNLGTGGILALKKVATGPPFLTPGTGVPAVNCIQTLSGVNTYSGDTTVAGGQLILASATAVSPNSAFRLFTVAQGQCPDNTVSLVLKYDGTAQVRQLWIDGVQQPNGVYGAGTPGIASTSTGTLTVTGYAPVVLEAARSGNALTFSWQGVYKLQSTTGSITGPWVDYPAGGTSPVKVTVDQAKSGVYFRLATY
jgi:autotransporter-associated beta strand protein